MSSSAFINGVKAELNSKKTRTENGAVAYRTSGKALLDMNFAVSAFRSKSEDEIRDAFEKAYFENPELAVRWLFFVRDVRGGMGERRLFRTCVEWLVQHNESLVKALIPVFAEYGRFDDMFGLLDNDNVKPIIIDYLVHQLHEDIVNCEANKSISLLAKWLPSANTSSRKTRALARILINEFAMSEKEYRQTLSKLRAHLRVLEVTISAGHWNEVDYSTVPSKANVRYKNAFLKNDEARRRQFLDKAVRGEVKMNSSVNFPYDIVHSYMGYYNVNAYDASLEALWKNLPDYVKSTQNKDNVIVVADGSGSMMSRIGNTNVTALDVANSLAIYFAERLSGPFKNQCITFSNRPQYIDMTNCKTLHDRISYMLKHDECASTNIEAVFDLMLKTAIKNHLAQEDIPDILVVSDMHFNQGVATGYGSGTLMERIAAKWTKNGYTLPRVTYWNVMGGCCRDVSTPVQSSESGIGLVSGFSPAIASMIFSKKTNPFEVLVEKLMSSRYDLIGKIFNEVK